MDVETTGAAAWGSRVLEIGAIRVEDGEVVGSMNQLLDPEEPIPYFISNLTGIENRETAGMPVFHEVSGEVERLFEGAVFVAHNVNFDHSFFTAEFARLGRKFDMDKFCTVRLSRALHPGERSHKLDEVIRRGGYQVAKRHRAYDDAEVLHKFYHDSLEAFGPAHFYSIAGRLLQPAKNRSIM